MISFIEYLVELEQSISFDPTKDTASDVTSMAKQALKIAASSPERALRARSQMIGDKKKTIQADKEDPLSKEKLQIKKMEERIARMKMNVARKEKSIGGEA